MTLGPHDLIDRRRLRAKLGFWRLTALGIAALAVLGASWMAFGDARGGGGGRETIARVEISGLITQDREMLELLETLAEEDRVRAVLVSVNSPGGTTAGGETIYEAIRKLAQVKPVAAQIETLGASAGYMVASAADHVVAHQSSIVGSIGVVSGGFGFVELLDKIGVERRVHTAGTNKAILDPFRPERPEDVEHLKRLQLEIHATFIELVRDSRGARLKDDPDLFTGLFWTGAKAAELGLVDRVGDLRSVLRERFGPSVKPVMMQAKRSLFGTRPAGFGLSSAEAVETAFAMAEQRALYARYGL